MRFLSIRDEAGEHSMQPPEAAMRAVLLAQTCGVLGSRGAEQATVVQEFLRIDAGSEEDRGRRRAARFRGRAGDTCPIAATADDPLPAGGRDDDADGVGALGQAAQIHSRADALAAERLDLLAVDVDARGLDAAALGLAQA